MNAARGLDCFPELRQIILAKPAASDDFERGSIQLYRNGRREGMLVSARVWGHSPGVGAGSRAGYGTSSGFLEAIRPLLR